MRQVPTEALKRQIMASIPVFLNAFMMGNTIGWTSNALYFFTVRQQIRATADEISLIASCNEFGRLVFAIPGGLLADKYGRKKIIVGASFLHFLSWLILSSYDSILCISVARFCLGVATALVNASSLIFIGEIVSPQIRGKFISIYQIFICIGSITQCIITVIFSSYHVLSYVTAVLSSICFICAFCTTETPNYLIHISKDNRARKHLNQIRPEYSEEDVDHEFVKLKQYIDEEKMRKSQLSWVMFFTSKSIAKPLGTFVLLNFFAMSTGNIVLGSYTTAILPENSFLSKEYYPLITQVTLLVPTIGASFYIERFSRRSLFMLGAALVSITHVFCAVSNFFYTEFKEDFIKWLFIVGNLLIPLICNAFILPMNSVMKSELLPQSIKGFGVSLGVIAQTVIIIVSYQLYNFVRKNLELYYIYVIFSFSSLALCFLVYLLLPEGRGKFLADIQVEFNRKASHVRVPENCDVQL